MNDRELLELAAKAAGIDLKPMQINNVREQGDDRFVGYMTDLEQWSRGWFNPLVNDDDALRLAVKLSLSVCVEIDQTWISAKGYPATPLCFVNHDGDPCAATRRAIVRAAAEIGKRMWGNNDSRK